MSVLQQAKWSVTKADRETGGIEAHVVMDMLTWTETFFLNLTRIGDNSTRFIMGRVGLAQPLDWELARQYIESFLNRPSTTLKNAS
jgi:hypothetical protein